MSHRQDDTCQQTVAVARAIESMKAELSRAQSLDDLARTGRFSPFHFHRIFRRVTTLTPARFLTTLRIAEARRLLVYSTMTVGDISWRVGYESLGTFTTQFGRLVGLSPGRFRHVMRALQHEVVARLLPAPRAGPQTTRGRAALGLGPCRTLVVCGVGPAGGLPERHWSWTSAQGTGTPSTGPVRLPNTLDPGEYAAFVAVVPAEVRVCDAFVDDVPGSYLIGAAMIRVPLRSEPHAGNEPHLEVVLRWPRPTDPPLLAVTPLGWLATPAAAA